MAILRLATFNVWGLPSPASRHPTERAQAIGEHLPELELDAIGFQEVWTASVRHTLVESGRRAGLDHSWHREANLGGSGLLILSRWPLSAPRFRLFRQCGLPQRLHHMDYYGGKGVARVTLSTPDGELDFLNTHLHAAYGPPGTVDEYRGHRVTEMLELAQEVAALPRPVVVVGDLNAAEDSDEMQILRGLTLLRDAAAELGLRAPTARLVPNDRAGGPARIDYILLRDGVETGLRAERVRLAYDEPIEIDGRAATHSDHIAVVAEVAMHSGGRALPAPLVEAADRAQERIAEGRRESRQRRSRQRRASLAAGALAVATATARGRKSRRDWLRTLLGVLTAALATPSVVLAALAEGFTPGDLAGYDEADEIAESFRRLARERARASG